MKTNNNPYAHIDSFGALQAEKIRMYYEVKLSKRKLDLRIIELESMLNPMRLVPFFVSELVRPLAGNMKEWFLNLIHGHKHKEEVKETDETPSVH